MEALKLRNATFSSSSAWKLCTSDKTGKVFGAPALKYIKQVQYEINLGRSINKESSARATDWGNLNEKRAFDLIPDLTYELVSNYRLFHSEIKHYSGMPDLVGFKKTGDIKCPFSLETFCDKLIALQNIETYKKEFPEDYWQHISNTILLRNNGVEIESFEACIYVPYKSELPDIKDSSFSYFEGNGYNWVLNADDRELPYLIDGGKYQNLNIFNFPIIEDDVLFLTERIKLAVSLLKHE